MRVGSGTRESIELVASRRAGRTVEQRRCLVAGCPRVGVRRGLRAPGSTPSRAASTRAVDVDPGAALQRRACARRICRTAGRDQRPVGLRGRATRRGSRRRCAKPAPRSTSAASSMTIGCEAGVPGGKLQSATTGRSTTCPRRLVSVPMSDGRGSSTRRGRDRTPRCGRAAASALVGGPVEHRVQRDEVVRRRGQLRVPVRLARGPSADCCSPT